MPRRGVGVGAAQRAKRNRAAFAAKGKELEELQMGHMEEQMSEFKVHLEEFARKHKKQINKDPKFRREFQQMCSKIGVDPLATNKGFWAEILGVGDFYFELGVQVIHVCLATREKNGGLMELGDLLEYLQRVRKRASDGVSTQEEIEPDDVKRAIKKLEVLGNGMRLVQVGARKMVVSVPCELSSDHTAVIQLAQGTGWVTTESIQGRLHWEAERIERSMRLLLTEGMVWVDDQAPDSKRRFCFPSISSFSGESADDE